MLAFWIIVSHHQTRILPVRNWRWDLLVMSHIAKLLIHIFITYGEPFVRLALRMHQNTQDCVVWFCVYFRVPGDTLTTTLLGVYPSYGGPLITLYDDILSRSPMCVCVSVHIACAHSFTHRHSILEWVVFWSVLCVCVAHAHRWFGRSHRVCWRCNNTHTHVTKAKEKQLQSRRFSHRAKLVRWWWWVSKESLFNWIIHTEPK